MRVIYRKIHNARYLYIKRNVEKVWGARYTLGARYLSKNTVLGVNSQETVIFTPIIKTYSNLTLLSILHSIINNNYTSYIYIHTNSLSTPDTSPVHTLPYVLTQCGKINSHMLTAKKVVAMVTQSSKISQLLEVL